MRYEVHLIRTVREYRTITVEADGPDKARRRALDIRALRGAPPTEEEDEGEWMGDGGSRPRVRSVEVIQ